MQVGPRLGTWMATAIWTLHICRYVELPNFTEDGLRNVLLRNDGNFSFTRCV